MGNITDEKAIATLIEGAIDKVDEAEAAMATAASMMRYVVAELMDPTAAVPDDPLSPV